jgi:hypothetical protein
MHKVLTYIEYRAVSGIFRTIDPHPLSLYRVCPPPAPKAGGGGVHTRRGVCGWGGGSIVRKTPDIGLASFRIIPLRQDGTVESWRQFCTPKMSESWRLAPSTENQDGAFHGVTSLPGRKKVGSWLTHPWAVCWSSSQIRWHLFVLKEASIL